MSRQWTQQQLNSIYATDGSVIVSAAAGSGKTAVLVERVINLITREENPIDVDRLLIVTFTRAAAAEMRQRLSDAISSLLEKDPYNPNLIKQKQLLYNASISTIDSFCSDLVREYFHTLSVARDYRIADDGELNMFSNTALDKSFETFYKKDDKTFYDLLDAFSSKGGDIKLRETVLKICTFLSTQPFPEKWLDEMLESYSNTSVKDSIWGKIILDYAQTVVLHALNLTENSIKLLEEDEKLKKSFIERLEDDLVFLTNLQKRMLGESWDEISTHLFSFSAGRLTAPRGYKDNPVKIAVSDNRDEVKNTLKSLQKYFESSEDEIKSEMHELQGLVKTLFELVKEYLNEYEVAKLKKNVLSFSDIELLTVKLLANPTDSGYEKTTQALEISERFDAVMVDEFQDVNDVQDLIFKCVSNNENNLFVVGDVKQSIYGFRQAKPQIFIERKNLYNKFDENNPVYPATIILDKNFRSRMEVCNTVNFIFSRLMTKQAAQMDYSKDEMLNVGATYPETNHCNFEINLIEKQAFYGIDSAEVEARLIAKRIYEIMSSNYTVTDGDKQRKATYGDFAVIMRSPKQIAKTYVNTLIECGIPAYSENKENSFETQEIKIILNLLRIIDNPTLDIPMLSVMCSPIYGFTPDELAQIKADSRYSNLYNAVKKYSEKSQKARDFLGQIDSLRAYSYTCSVDEIIGKVYETTAFSSITSAVKGGTSPLRNLNLLRIYARTFESNGYKTLSDFISYIDRLIENSTELSAASNDTDSLNAVRVLSIHASKGLEYPICFIADTARQFNKTDLKSDVLIDSNAGLGIKKRVDLCRYNTLPRLAVEIEIGQNEIAEELRVLYVALTRAREKLIVISSQKNSEKYLSSIYSKIVFDKIIEPYAVTSCKSVSDWIFLSALVHPSFNSVRNQINMSSNNIFFDEDTLEWNFNHITDAGQIFELVEKNDVNIINTAFEIANDNISDSSEYYDLLMKNLSFEYRNSKIINLPQKVSASQIAHDANDEYFKKVLLKPSFISKKDLSSVERGTAHHKFLQYCDFVNARIDIVGEINKLVDYGYLTEEQAESIDKENLSELLKSELFTRIIESSFVLREEQFTVKIKPSLIYDEYKGIDTDATVIMQGAVDLVFEENGKLVIVDYKTDRVGEVERLSFLYKKQLDLYREAIQQSVELPVKECILCSVYLSKYITI